MSDWQLIYATDSTGAAVSGSVEDLSTAVFRGADVKIVYNPTPDSGIWWSRYCASVSTRRVGGARLVTATYSQALDTAVGGSGVEFAVPFAVEYHIYNSNGVQLMSKGGSASSRIVAMRWYVKDYRSPSIVSALQAALGQVFVRRG